MPNIRIASEEPIHRPRCALRGGVIIALVLVGCTAFGVFAALYSEPLPDEMLAAYASRWAAIDPSAH